MAEQSQRQASEQVEEDHRRKRQAGPRSREPRQDQQPGMDPLQRLQGLADNSPQAAQLRRLRELANNTPQANELRRLQTLARGEERSAEAEPTTNATAKAEATTGKPEPATAKPNLTGLPDQLKSNIEALSGLSMDAVRVHYNSTKPAQLNALAYAQGSDIHLGPGQEQHLPHEAWHVVQQAQGRVRPTLQMAGGVAVNDDAGLEREADVMGGRAFRDIPNPHPLPCMIFHDYYIPIAGDVSDEASNEDRKTRTVAHLKTSANLEGQHGNASKPLDMMPKKSSIYTGHPKPTQMTPDSFKEYKDKLQGTTSKKSRPVLPDVWSKIAKMAKDYSELDLEDSENRKKCLETLKNECLHWCNDVYNPEVQAFNSDEKEIPPEIRNKKRTIEMLVTLIDKEEAEIDAMPARLSPDIRKVSKEEWDELEKARNWGETDETCLTSYDYRARDEAATLLSKLQISGKKLNPATQLAESKKHYQEKAFSFYHGPTESGHEVYSRLCEILPKLIGEAFDSHYNLEDDKILSELVQIAVLLAGIKSNANGSTGGRSFFRR